VTILSSAPAHTEAQADPYWRRWNRRWNVTDRRPSRRERCPSKALTLAESNGREQGLKETAGGEFGGFTDDETGLACEQIEVGQGRSASG
jgi:hypothetical protein